MVQPLGQGLERGQLGPSDSGGNTQSGRRGWYGYFKWSQPTAMQRVDEWTRERIRHIVRRRCKGRGMVKARERNEYNVAWFAERGFFSLWSAQARWLQSQTGNH
jgi:hypothetical protein